jgi:hypothetical protein
VQDYTKLNYSTRLLAQTDSVLTELHLHSALKSYSAHLSATEKDAANREAAAERTLKEYENARGMADIAKRYIQALKEIEEVRREIQKLETGEV